MTTWRGVWTVLDAEKAQSADAIAIELAADTSDVQRAAEALRVAGILGSVDGHYCRAAEAENKDELEQLAAAAGIDLAASLKPRGALPTS